MASTTTRLGLRKPAPSDAVDVTADLDNNWDVVDAVVGTIICTSSSRPSTPFTGQTIRETDTGFSYIWDGTTWVFTTRGITMCTSGTRPDATHSFVGLMIYETDTNLIYICTNATGPVWTLYPRGAILCTSTTRPAAPVVGTLIYETDTADFVICVATTPTWIVLERAYVYGGKDVVHSANITATGNNTTEILINNMDSGSMDLLANTRYLIRVKWLYSASAIGTYAAPAAYFVRIRDTNVSGTERAKMRIEPTVVSTQYYGEMTAIYETTTAETGKVFVFSAQRITATGVITFVGAGTGIRLGMDVYNMGHAGQLTQVTS